MTVAPSPAYRPLPAIAGSAALAAVGTSVVNVAIGLIAGAAGVSQAGPMQPVSLVAVSVVASIVGAIGWHVVNRRATAPGRVLRWLVPTVLVASFLTDIPVGFGLGWDVALVLAIMHVPTIVIAVAVYRRMLPLTDRVPRRTATPALG